MSGVGATVQFEGGGIYGEECWPGKRPDANLLGSFENVYAKNRLDCTACKRDVVPKERRQGVGVSAHSGLPAPLMVRSLSLQ